MAPRKGSTCPGDPVGYDSDIAQTSVAKPGNHVQERVESSADSLLVQQKRKRRFRTRRGEIGIAAKLEQDGLVVTDQMMGEGGQVDATARLAIELGEQRMNMGQSRKDAMTREGGRQRTRRTGLLTGRMNPPPHRPEEKATAGL
jgi:hypothetical protein